MTSRMNYNHELYEKGSGLAEDIYKILTSERFEEYTLEDIQIIMEFANISIISLLSLDIHNRDYPMIPGGDTND